MSSLLLLAAPAQADESVPPKRDETAPNKGTSTVEITGAAMFGAAYAPAFVMGTASVVDALGNFRICVLAPCREPQDDGAALLIPIVGPLMYAEPSARDDLLRTDRPSNAERAALYSSAAVQTAGLVTLLVGVMQSTPARRAPRSVVTPLVSPSASGIAMSGTF